MAFAQDVTLTSRDGSVEIVGNLLGFDGEFYRVQTDFGDLTLDGTGVLCAGPGCPDLESYVARLQISGAATAGDVLMPALVEGFGLRYGYSVGREDIEQGVVRYTLTHAEQGRLAGEFVIRSGTTNEGFADLLADHADIVMALREVRTNENALAQEAGLGDLRRRGRSLVVALDALVPVVAPDNPVARISVPDLARVFAGEVVNWRDLGGPDAPIAVHLRDADSGPGQAAEDLLMQPAKLVASDTATRHRDNAGLIDAVMTDPFAIGLAVASEPGETKPLRLSGACGFTVGATRRAAKTEDYPLTMPVLLYRPGYRLPKLAREFLAYVAGPSAQLVIRRAGFVDQAMERIAIADQGERFANAIGQAGAETSLAELQRMVRVLGPMQRLSPTFRFRAGSTVLDVQSQSNVQLLASALESGEFDGKRVVLIGFSDGAGSAELNRGISLQRAEAVREAIRASVVNGSLERVSLEVASFGEALPMACDDSAWGRQANRRVEVWLREDAAAAEPEDQR